MSWNGSGDTGRARTPGAPQKKSSGISPAVVKGIAGGLVAVAVVSAALFLIFSGGDASDGRARTPAAPKKIQEVTPAPAPKAAVPVQQPKPVDPNARPTKPGQKLNGFVMLPNGRLHKIKGEVTNDCASAKGEYAIFRHPSENIIAGILTIEPGQTVIGTPNYNGRVTQDFLKSLSEPIIPTAEDSEEHRELKRAVNEAKIELKAAYDRGEDIEEILLKTREDFQRLAQYKQDLRKEVLKFANREASSQEDVDDYLAAANKMLEARGIAPIEDTPLAKIKFRMKEKWEKEEK